MLEIQTSGGTTQKYKVASGGLNGEFNGGSNPKDIYVIRLVRGFKNTDSEILADTYLEANDSITIKLYQEKEVNKPEFAGKFFVKIARDSVFDTNIISTFPAITADYSIVKSREIYHKIQSEYSKAVSDDGKTLLRARQDLGWIDDNDYFNSPSSPDFKKSAIKHPNSGSFSKKMVFYWAGVDYGDGWDGLPLDENVKQTKGAGHDRNNTINPFLEDITSAGTLFSFANDAEDSDNIYLSLIHI